MTYQDLINKNFKQGDSITSKELELLDYEEDIDMIRVESAGKQWYVEVGTYLEAVKEVAEDLKSDGPLQEFAKGVEEE